MARITQRPTRHYRRESRSDSLLRSVFHHGTSSQHFRPSMWFGLGSIVVAALLNRFLRVDVGLLAVVVGAIAVVLVVVYSYRSAARARADMAAKREAFHQQIMDDYTDDSRDT